jgi:hypothetical protein
MTDNITVTKHATVTGIVVPTGGLFPAATLNADALQKLNWCIENGEIFFLGVIGEEEDITGATWVSATDYSIMYNSGAGSLWGSGPMSSWFLDTGDGSYLDGGTAQTLCYDGVSVNKRHYVGFPTSGLGYPAITSAEIWINRPAPLEGNGTHIHFNVYPTDLNLNILTAYDLMEISAPANEPPTCIIAVDTIVNRVLTIEITGEDDVDLEAGVIDWDDTTTTSLSVGELATLQGGGTISKSHTYDSAGGSFDVTCTLEDSEQSTTSNTLNVSISGNSSPVASFTVDVDFTDHLTVTINANASNDPDGSIASWRFQPYEGAAWIDGVLGVALEYEYAAHGTYDAVVEVTDNEGMTDTETASIAVLNSAPNASATYSALFRTLTLTNTSTDSDGVIAFTNIDWGDGSEPEAIAVDAVVSHEYPNTTASYDVVIDVEDEDGATDSSAVITFNITEFEPDFTSEFILGELNVEADLTVPAGLTVETYEWVWGDSETNGSGSTATHTYEDGLDTHNVTLNVILSDDNTYTVIKEITQMPAPTITSVLPLGAVVASTTITIVGTNFGASQDTSTIKIGATAETAVEVTTVLWGATTVTCKAGALTVVGLQNVYVTVGTDTATATDAVMVLTVDAFDTTAIKLGTMSKMYIDGQHVGYLQDNVEIQPSAENKDYIPNDQYMPVVTKVIRQNCNVRFTLSQISAKNLAIAISGQYSEATKTTTLKSTPVNLAGTAGVPEYSLYWIDAAGVTYFVPRAQITEPANIVLNAQDFMNLPLAMRALPDTNGVVAKWVFPA